MRFIVSFLAVTLVIAIFQTLQVVLVLLKGGKKLPKQTSEFVKWLILILVSTLLAFEFGVEAWSIVWKTI